MRPRYRTRRQQQQTGDQQDGNEADLLPVELLQLLASKLDFEDLASAAMTCRHWAKVFRSGLTRATFVCGGDARAASPWAVVHSLLKYNAVTDLEVLLNSRSSFSCVRDTLGSLSVTAVKNLKLVFLTSETPRRGSWPMFFADKLDATALESLTIDSPDMPEEAISDLLDNLSSEEYDCVLRHLELRLGRSQRHSQLQQFKSPAWLLDTVGLRCNALRGEHISLISGITSLRSLHCDLHPLISPTFFEHLSNLTGLTEFVTGNVPISVSSKLPLLRSLRRLKLAAYDFNVLDVDLSFVQDLDLGLPCSLQGKGIGELLSRAPANLKGLSYYPLMIEHCDVGSLAATLSGLTSLQLFLVYTAAPWAQWDLTPLSQLSGLQQFTLSGGGFNATSNDGLGNAQLKFELPPSSKPGRVLTGPCESVGKRRKSAAQQQLEQHLQHQQEAEAHSRWSDISAMFGAWPKLQDLALSGLSPFAVANTDWAGLSACSSLTSLALQFLPLQYELKSSLQRSHRLKRPEYAAGGGMVVLRAEHFPAGLKDLLLTGCCIGVPVQGSLRAGESLESISLSRCFVDSIQKGASTRRGDPIVVVDSWEPMPSDSQQQHPLPLLLQHTPQLRMLELIDLPWLTDAVLGAAAAAPSLRGLRSLSVVGVGQQRLTHGGLLGLTGLKKLRELRWHVGDSLELMPDVQALVQLKGLMRLHIPNWLHNKMERWGGYAALDSMPLCDVNVELVQ